MPLNLRDLQHFLAIAETGSFTEAGARRALSQPALSRAIRQLEDRLGDRLFDRDGRGARLSPAGARLMPIAVRLVREAELGLEDVSAFIRGSRGRLCVAALPSLAATLLPGPLAAFQAEYPDIDIKILDGLAMNVETAVLEGHADLGLTIRPLPNIDLSYQELQEDLFGAVRANDRPDLDVRSWADITKTPFIAMALRSSVRQATDQAFLQAGVSVRPLYECGHLATVGALVGRGLGVTALPKLTLRLLPEPDFLWTPLDAPTTKRSVGFVTRPDRRSPTVEALIQHLTTPHHSANAQWA
ncbi:DNA-binding transcriptional LysR family regulator [Brevundimonas nasdae]|uniref:LysR family transcriptional regulator n=1 Tax=Brevundimonas nasdae TaxID=172043 RepID=UPI001914B93C|nr:LysR family transcriptional regulator [Brevundimonas nasdae]MBK6025818.1 LysR family transcriptional regulator [Brevundimonas nasdae]MDQ0452329.1 DNA-binding transcriptional LysR family regulator [Brevundimonas nasdae]